ncbi:MAG: hypothetical protein SOY07_01195 [Bacteroidales bacterium]|nr:hypothetical protein [Bacteroidales bacterium]
MKFLVKLIVAIVSFFMSLFPIMAQSSFTTTVTTTQTSNVGGKDTTIVTRTVTTTTIDTDVFSTLGAAFTAMMPDSATMNRFMKSIVVVGDTVASKVKKSTVKGMQNAKVAIQNAKLTQAEADNIRAVLDVAAAKIDDWLKSVTENSK